MTASDDLRRRLHERIDQLPSSALPLLDGYVDLLQQSAPAALQPMIKLPPPDQQKPWPHSPLHRIHENGTFIVTAATLQKQHVFGTSDRLNLLENELLKQAQDHGWQLEAWAVFSNHYHFVGHTLPDAAQLSDFLGSLHATTARRVNEADGEPGRDVWFNYWDTQLTFERSYLARLSYVHQNAVRHGLVAVANQYRWCSAAWFERTAKPAQVATIYSFKIDAVNILDDYQPISTN